MPVPDASHASGSTRVCDEPPSRAIRGNVSVKYFIETREQEWIVTLEPGPDACRLEALAPGEAPSPVSRQGWHQAGTAVIDGRVYRVRRSGEGLSIESRLAPKLEVRVRDRPLVAALGREARGPTRHRLVKAPLPGQVVQVLVAAGDEVGTGQRLIVLEAMKMQNPILADRPGTISEIQVSVGDTVPLGATLLELDE